MMDSRPRVLIVDDSPAAQELGASLLHEAGYVVAGATTGGEALRLAAEFRPDIVLLDVVLPDQSGIEVCRRLKSAPETCASLVALISSMETASDRQAEGLEVGADTYIVRPIPNRELLARIAALARLKRTEDALHVSRAEALANLEAARAGEARFRALLESAPDAMVQVDAAGILTFVNRQGLDLFGYSEGELVGQPIEILVPERFRPRHVGLRNAFLAALQSGRAEVGRDLVARRKDGSEFAVAINLSVVPGPDGFAVLAAVRDVTDRRRMEQALARRTQQLEAVQYVTAEITRELNLERLLDLVVRKAKELLEEGEVLLRLWDESQQALVPAAASGRPATQAWFPIRLGEGVSGAAAGRRQGLIVNDFRESPYATPALLGSTAHTAVLAEPLLYRNELIGVLVVRRFSGMAPFAKEDQELLALFAGQAAVGIANARLYSEAERQRARLKEILDSAVEGFYQTTPEGRILTANGTFARILGYESPAALIAAVPDITRVYRDPSRRADLQRIMLEEGSVTDFEVELLRPKGGPVWVTINARRVADAAGRTRYYEGFVQDISERKTAEQLKADFISFATHQLRTPLAGIRWMLELAAQEEGLPAGAGEFVQDARASTERLIKLVNDLLDVTRLERGKIAVSLEPVDLAALTRDVLAEMAGPIREKEHQVTVSLPDDVPPVKADRQLLREAMLNLCSNAVKYTPAGGRIAVRARPVPANADSGIRNGDWKSGESRPQSAIANPKSKMVEWSIADTGIGIPAPAQGRLFEKFFRADNVLTMETEGTGLGLYLVRLIVERLGGRARCESEEGQGSRFTLELPAPE
jgi:PAS domain S-box-containing protein